MRRPSTTYVACMQELAALTRTRKASRSRSDTEQRTQFPKMTSSSNRGETAQRHAKFQGVWRKWVLGFISAAFLMGMTIGVAFTYPPYQSGSLGK
ncbi:hypothetical protein MTO96_049304 [Rhipicephalus appendiculatus]